VTKEMGHDLQWYIPRRSKLLRSTFLQCGSPWPLVLYASNCEGSKYISRRWLPLISTTNRKKRRQFARAHQNWTVEDWKNAWSDESRFLLRHSDGRVRIWRKQTENMDAMLTLPLCRNQSKNKSSDIPSDPEVKSW